MSSTVVQNSPGDVQTENRRIQRIALPLPARVEVKVDKTVSWHEVVRLEDISAFGAGFSLSRPVKRGRIILMMLPMPRQLRCYDHSEPQYRIWALIRRCVPIGLGQEDCKYVTGVAFIGQHAPMSYHEDPTRLYDISHRGEEGIWHVVDAANIPEEESGLPRDARRQTRFSIPETVALEVMDESGNVLSSETTVTENVSVGGAAVFTSLDAQQGTFIRVNVLRNDVKIISVVRSRRKGPDGLTRLHLEFVDRLFPMEGLE
jgi:PilZ domain-containing protein